MGGEKRTNAGRESPQGMKFTTRTRSYEGQCEENERGSAPEVRRAHRDPVYPPQLRVRQRDER
eukprot:31554-Pelagococcus_subviridis.AAC.5